MLQKHLTTTYNNAKEIGKMQTGWLDTYDVTGLAGNTGILDDKTGEVCLIEDDPCYTVKQQKLWKATRTHKWYYLGTDGKMVTGWQMINGAWYYFYSNGEMASNCNISGYTLGADGSLQ